MGFWDMFKRSAKKGVSAASDTASSAASTATSTANAAAAKVDSAVVDPLKDAVTGSQAEVADADVEAAVAEEIAQDSGGLSGMLDKLGAGGLGDTVQSWIGKGENKSINADQLKSALGGDKLQAIASKLGVSTDMAADKLAAVLPTVIDKLTPDGMVPDPQALSDKLTGFMKNKL